jgi:ankyrin repeat protein
MNVSFLFSRVSRFLGPWIAAPMLHKAVQGGDVKKVKALLKGNPHLVSSKDKNGKTSLHWAAFNGHKEEAVLLLANKADVNVKDINRKTPLEVVPPDRPEIRALLLAMHNAAGDGDLEKVKALLKSNPDMLFLRDKNGCEPLHFAAYKGHNDVAEFLLANFWPTTPTSMPRTRTVSRLCIWRRPMAAWK